jgi:hypothetical protein
MNQRYFFRKHEESDLPEIANLINQVFGRNRNSEYFEWLYRRNPVGQALAAVVLCDGSVVGLMSAIPVKYSVSGTDVLFAQNVDLAIIERYRRLDVYMKLIVTQHDTLSQGNVKFSFGFTNKYSSAVASQTHGSKKIGTLPRFVKVLNARPFLAKTFSNKTLSKIVSPIANALLCTWYPRNVKIPIGLELKRIRQFDERFDIFWDQIKADYPIMAVRDKRYLNWRYKNGPHMNSEVACLQRVGSNEIVGFTVLGEIYRDECLRGQIYEIVTPRSGKPQITRCLLRFAVNHFYQKKTDVIDCWMFPHCHVHPELMKIGFVSRKKNTINFYSQNLHVNDFAVHHDFLINHKNWYISIGDSDTG